MIAVMRANMREAKKILNYLKDNPRTYYKSPEEEMFKSGEFDPFIMGILLGSVIKKYKN